LFPATLSTVGGGRVRIPPPAFNPGFESFTPSKGKPPFSDMKVEKRRGKQEQEENDIYRRKKRLEY